MASKYCLNDLSPDRRQLLLHRRELEKTIGSLYCIKNGCIPSSAAIIEATIAELSKLMDNAVIQLGDTGMSMSEIGGYYRDILNNEI